MTGPADAPAPTTRELRRFALAVGGAFVVLGAAGAWRGRATAAAAFGVLGGALLVAGLAVPARLGPVYVAWMGLAHAVSRVTTPIFLGVIYFGVFTPFGLVMRIAGRRSLGRPRGAASFWVERPPGARQSDLRRQF